MNFSRNRKAGALAVVAGFALVGSACSTSYDRAEVIDELVTEQGVDRALATCVVDGMEERIGVDRLDDRGNPTPEEEEIIIEITTDCLLAG
ncbi:MAG: hypothetical protein ACR2QO_25395 [Acidimicrobiales bacterium]